MDRSQNCTDDTRDCCADEIIQSCFDLAHPKSFFLFAGAGSGKTRSLVSALKYIDITIGRTLKLSGRKVAVITYTKAARDEISNRSQYNSLFEISTIHSFAWHLMSSHTTDIREWLKNDIGNRINEAENKQASSKSTTTKAYKDREKKLSEYRRRLEYIDSVTHFIYNPDGINIENNSLDHAEVIKLTAELLCQKETLQKILVDKYPILLIDESQDTKKELMNVFLQLQSKYSDRFTLGLIGDTMQRIYLDGKEDLRTSIPEDWKKPLKVMNHRSQKRIVDLCNQIRIDVDGIQQQPRADKPKGFVRIFITDSLDPYSTEEEVRVRMSQMEDDDRWLIPEEVKCLTIEHKMAAYRLGFATFFEHLNNISSYRQGLMNGTLSAIGLYTHILIPLRKADLENNYIEKMRIVRDNSLQFQERHSSLESIDIAQLSDAVDRIISCWRDNDPTCRELLNIVHDMNIFPIARDLKTLIEHPLSVYDEDYAKFHDLELALNSKLSEVERYYAYITGDENFDTHQGVKGLEYEKVMVIIDDSASRGSTFNYNKLFGLEEKSATDIRNEQEGKETTLDRTKRLLYVTCSRAKNSLAIVYYTPSVSAAHQAISMVGWFEEDEIIEL